MANKTLKIVNKKNQVVLADSVVCAETFFKRLIGLMFKGKINKNQGLFIKNCKAIHTFFMRFSIDAVFIDKDNRVIAIYENLRPFIGITKYHSSSIGVLEFLSGTARSAELKVDDTLVIENL